MVKIKSITQGETIQPDPNNPEIIDGTIQNPIPYKFIDIIFEDGVRVQVEKETGDTKAKIIAKVKTKYQSQQSTNSVSGISEDDDISMV